MQKWVENELSGVKFGDKRLNTRYSGPRCQDHFLIFYRNNFYSI